MQMGSFSLKVLFSFDFEFYFLNSFDFEFVLQSVSGTGKKFTTWLKKWQIEQTKDMVFISEI